jgi:hypothetical protein
MPTDETSPLNVLREQARLQLKIMLEAKESELELALDRIAELEHELELARQPPALPGDEIG